MIQPTISFVETAPSVKLEVLEWSKEGPPLMFLAGGGHTAHVFDLFAHHFTDRFRVIGITRRSYGTSSKPVEDYSITDLGNDIVAILNHFSLDRANFVGHSFGGAEMNELALNHSSRIRRLVYIDGARGFRRVFLDPDWDKQPWPVIPMTLSDTASSQSVADHYERNWGSKTHLSEIEARYQFDRQGRLFPPDPNAPDIEVGMIGPTLPEIDFSKFTVPVLAIRCMPRSAQEMFPGCFEYYDSENQQFAKDTYQLWSRLVFTEDDRFIAGIPEVKELKLPDAHHEVHLTEPERIIGPIRSFLLKQGSRLAWRIR